MKERFLGDDEIIEHVVVRFHVSCITLIHIPSEAQPNIDDLLDDSQAKARVVYSHPCTIIPPRRLHIPPSYSPHVP
jgi:hypothetical protein